jgi:S1-C subfamily serine protease
LLSRTGFIVTAAHVIARADVITVTTPDGVDHRGHAVGRDETHDLGLIRIDGEDHHPVALSDAGASPGMFVVAVGRPPRAGFAVSHGIVSALNRATRTPSGQLIDDLVQTTATVEPGVSGGAIADSRGRLLGVVTSASDSSGAISFAIGTPAIRNAVARLIPESAGIASPLMPPPIT